MSTSNAVVAPSLQDAAGNRAPSTVRAGDRDERPRNTIARTERDRLLAPLAAAIDELRADQEAGETADEPRRRALAQLQAIAAGHEAFCRQTAHDLRNPLAAIRGQTQLLLRRVQRDAEAGTPTTVDRLTGGLAAIDDAVTRMSALIADLLERPADLEHQDRQRRDEVLTDDGVYPD